MISEEEANKLYEFGDRFLCHFHNCGILMAMARVRPEKSLEILTALLREWDEFILSLTKIGDPNELDDPNSWPSEDEEQGP
jgi:hypothetical protein